MEKKNRSPEEVVRELKKAKIKEDYRERALALFGLICARCGREFEESNRHLLTVHHKDGNHLYNPPDGSNWELLCVYCHEDIHSRGLLGDFLSGKGGQEISTVYREGEKFGLTLGEKLKKALEEKKKK